MDLRTECVDPKSTAPRRAIAPQHCGITADLAKRLGSKIIGQAEAVPGIVECVEMYEAGIAAPHRPAGVFLLLGPTGTGKTRTVEALAEELHGSAQNMLRIDCGEFQMEHEVSKLIGAPPGYLGHRETQPVLSQQRLTASTSDACDLSIVMFDEIEKAAPSMTRMMLGILDRGILRLGDNSTVDFEKSIIFMTSNLGAKEMAKALAPAFGFQSAEAQLCSDKGRKLEAIAAAAVKKKFSPEFMNRIDLVATYRPLDAPSLAAILDLELSRLQEHVDTRLGMRTPELCVPAAARQWLIRKGTSVEYGARELKRTIHRTITRPLAGKILRKEVPNGARVTAKVTPGTDELALHVTKTSD